ncbi:MAG: hypothetical protein CM15mP71_4020 [Candidatus Poseidoniales archaeon]|nr:MAG: hypothetical protein CM15mP71_4020 [Candidatus Poseidoniales archaeon]
MLLLGPYCHSFDDVISVQLYMYGVNLTEVYFEWEIYGTWTGQIYASDDIDSTVGGTVPVDLDGRYYISYGNWKQHLHG